MKIMKPTKAANTSNCIDINLCIYRSYEDMMNAPVVKTRESSETNDMLYCAVATPNLAQLAPLALRFGFGRFYEPRSDDLSKTFNAETQQYWQYHTT